MCSATQKMPFIYLIHNYALLQSNMVSPYSVHQQQLAFLSQQQALLMAVAKSGTVNPTLSGSSNQPAVTGLHAPNINVLYQNWPNIGYQAPGVTPLDGQKDFNNFSQVMPGFKNANKPSNLF